MVRRTHRNAVHRKIPVLPTLAPNSLRDRESDEHSLDFETTFHSPGCMDTSSEEV